MNIEKEKVFIDGVSMQSAVLAIHRDGQNYAVAEIFGYDFEKRAELIERLLREYRVSQP